MNKKMSKRRRDIKSKLMAAICMLLVSSIMMVSTTYAWFTLSTAPEVTGIQTAVGAVRAGFGDQRAAVYHDVAIGIHTVAFLSQRIHKGQHFTIVEGDDRHPVFGSADRVVHGGDLVFAAVKGQMTEFHLDALFVAGKLQTAAAAKAQRNIGADSAVMLHRILRGGGGSRFCKGRTTCRICTPRGSAWTTG